MKADAKASVKGEPPTAAVTETAAARAREEEQALRAQLEAAEQKRRAAEVTMKAARAYEAEREVALTALSDGFTTQADKLLQRKVTTAADWFTLAQELAQLRSEFDRQVSESARDNRERFLGTDYVRRFTDTHPTAKLMQWLAGLVG